MGQTLENLSKKSLPDKPIFAKRFVIEVCESIHVHYRNLRISLKLFDWISLAEGFSNSLERWRKRGEPMPDKKNHIELCRKDIDIEDESDQFVVNLNHNLYKHHKDEIFSEGAEIEDDLYIHMKIRDLRLEFSVEEFKVISDGIKEASEKLQDRSASPLLQT